MRKIAIFSLAALAALTLACSMGDTDTSSSVSGGETQKVTEAKGGEKTTTTAKIGQKVTLTNDLLGEKTAIEVTVANAKQYAKTPGDFGMEPDNGTFLVVDVTVVCKDGSYSTNPFNFKLVAKDGTVADPALATFKPALSLTELSKGQKVSGKVVFDVSKAALKGAKIQIDGVGLDFDKPAAYWAL
jgi:hypothetical protein